MRIPKGAHFLYKGSVERLFQPFVRWLYAKNEGRLQSGAFCLTVHLQGISGANPILSANKMRIPKGAHFLYKGSVERLFQPFVRWLYAKNEGRLQSGAFCLTVHLQGISGANPILSANKMRIPKGAHFLYKGSVERLFQPFVRWLYAKNEGRLQSGAFCLTVPSKGISGANPYFLQTKCCI